MTGRDRCRAEVVVYFLTMVLCLACFFGAYEAVVNGLWWASPFAVIGGVFFFLCGDDDDD